MNYIKEYTDFISEAKWRSASEINRETEDLLKGRIERYTGLMKTNPDKTEIYKARLELAHARLNVLAAKKKLEQLRARS